MPIRTIAADDLTTFVIEGKATLEEMKRAVDSLYVGKTPTKVIWDLALADVSDAAPQDLHRFVQYAAERGRDRTGNRVAIVAPEDLQFGMSRMSTTFADLQSAAYDMNAFRDYDTALQWLEGREDEP